MPLKTKPVIAVDIGGTKIMTALFSADGKMRAKDVRPTRADEGVDAVVERLFGAIQYVFKSDNLAFSQIQAVSLACAGGIDTDKGVVITPSPSLPEWSGLPLADILKNKSDAEVYLLNDASAAALGEQRYGAGKGVKDLVLLTLGTGIGGGIIIDGKLYLGADGGAGELGHMTVEAGGLPCGCGNTGCLEMYTSGRAVAAEAAARLRKGEKSGLIENVENLTAEMVGNAAQKGDKLACDVIARAAFYLGVGMVNIANIFNPDMIIIGGGLAGLGEMLIAPGRKMVAERAFSINSRNVKIVKAKLGTEAGVYGAATFAYDKRRTA